MTRRAVLYARVSGDDRANSTSSLEGQLELGRQRAAERGYSIVAEFADNETSGARMDAHGLTRALDMARSGQFDVLIVRELDRLSRSLAKQLLVEEDLKRAGVSIEYVIGEYADTPEGILNKNIKAVVAEYERLKVSERMTRGRMTVVRSGGVLVHGNAPFGYDAVHDEFARRWDLVINDDQAAIVRLMYDWYINAGLSARAIALKLNDMGIPSPKGNKWYPAVVRTMLINETYAGVWRYGKRTGKGITNPVDRQIAVEVPAIIDRPVWERAQQQRAVHADNSFRNQKYCYLMGKRATCAACGGKMGVVGVKSGGAFGYYKCTAARSSWVTHSCEQRRHFRTDIVDRIAWSWVTSILLNPQRIEEGYRTYLETADEQNAPLLRQAELAETLLRQEEDKLSRLIDLYLSGKFDRESLLDRKQRLETTVASLRSQRDTLAARVSAQELERAELVTLMNWIGELGDGLDVVNETDDFATKRGIIDGLDVRASLAVEDGERVVYMSCKIDRSAAIVLSTKRCEGHNVTIDIFTLSARIALRDQLAAEFGALMVTAAQEAATAVR